MNPEDTQQLIESTADLNITYLGSRKSNLGTEQNIELDDEYRLTHVLTTGPTGYGKTQEMAHVVLQDGHKGRGFAVINPKGDLIDELIAKLPEDRLDDIIYINPAEEPVTPINILETQVTEDMNEAQKENQKEIIVSDLVNLFKRQSKEWGDRFGRVLETLIRACVDLNIRQNSGYTLIDLFQAVVDDDALSNLIDETTDPVIREELVSVKEDLSSSQLEPLQRRLNDFVMNSTIRRVIGAEQSGFDFREALDQQKIILVDVQKGEVGGTVSEIVGSIVITNIWAAAQSRITEPENQRVPFHLYVDELDNFSGEGSNFASILSEAREYRLGCWLSTQYLYQLTPDMRKAVKNNCRTKIAFNPSGTEKLPQLTGMFQGLDRGVLTSMGKYRAAVQKPSEKQQRDAVIFDTYPPWEADRSAVDAVKKKRTAVKTGNTQQVKLQQSLGNSANAGGEHHQEMLHTAEELLEERGFNVTLVHQGTGEDKPDGRVTLPGGETAHLEAEHSTLSKPAKVLQNVRRAVEKDREVLFVVEQGKASKLENIVSDPVNRRGNQHEDTKGTYSYYTDSDGNPVDDINTLSQVEYRILELDDEELSEVEELEPKCPQLDEYTEEDLEGFCLYREEDGYCSELGQQCVITADD